MTQEKAHGQLRSDGSDFEQQPLALVQSEFQNEVSIINRGIATLEEEAANLRDEVARLQEINRGIATLEEEAANLRDEIARLQEINRVTSRRLKVVTCEHGLVVARKKGLEDQLAASRAETATLQQQLQNILKSSSWELTAPFRAIGRRVPRLAPIVRGLLRPFRRLLSDPYLRSQPYVRQAIVSEPEASTVAMPPLHHTSDLLSQESSTPLPVTAAADLQIADTGKCHETNVLTAFCNRESREGANTIFVAADMPPMFDKHSGSLRLYSLLRIMNELGWRIVFASMMDIAQFSSAAGSPMERERYERALRGIGVEEIAYGSEDADKLLDANGRTLRWAFLSFAIVANQFIPRVRVNAPWARVIYDMVDFHSLRIEREAKLKSDPVIQAEADRIRAIELTNARTADVTIAISEEERRHLSDADSAITTEVIPNVFEIPKQISIETTRRRGLFFVGGFWHTPNIDAMTWFVSDIWELIRRQEPDITLCIAGSNMPPEILALASTPNVQIAGFVPDLTDWFERSRVFVAPLRYGAGLKGKIGQSMAYGLPVVTTQVGAEGMGLMNGEHALIADKPQDFANAVIRLVHDDTLWSRLQTGGRNLIESTQSVDVVRKRMESLLNG